MSGVSPDAVGRNAVVALLLALAVVLAGCGGTNGTTATSIGPAVETESTTLGTGTPTGTPTETSTRTATPSPTPSLDEATLGDRHDRELWRAGSFTVDYVATMRTENGTVVNDRHVAVNRDGGVGYSSSNTTVYDPDGTPNVTITAETYVGGTTEYERTKLGDVDDPLVVEDTLRAPDGINETNVMAGNGTVATRSGDVEYWVEGHDWRWDGVTTLDGDVVNRYRLASSRIGTVVLDEVLFGNHSVVTGVRATNSRLLVDDGAVRLLELDLRWTNDGATNTMTVTLRVTDVGSTTVTRPEWVDG